VPRFAIAPLGLTTEGSTNLNQKVENATLKNYSVDKAFSISTHTRRLDIRLFLWWFIEVTAEEGNIQSVNLPCSLRKQ